jgi:hypothetical protein
LFDAKIESGIDRVPACFLPASVARRPAPHAAPQQPAANLPVRPVNRAPASFGGGFFRGLHLGYTWLSGER